jgi:GNAT superfamily N-acetyltransferase
MYDERDVTIEVRGARWEERPAVCHLIDAAFDAESHGPSLTEPCVSVGNSHLDPHDRPWNTRVLLADGEIVSTVHVAERDAYARSTRVRFGFVAMVATHPAHRRRGYMRRLMSDAETHMRSRGSCYAVLFGRFGTYASLGWRWCDEKRATFVPTYTMPCRAESAVGTAVRAATEDDIAFLSHAYCSRYGTRFGPVMRSQEYWRRWSLQCEWNGAYMMVCDAAGPIGYFHVDGDSVDEIGWKKIGEGMPERVFRAASAHGAAKGARTLSLWLGDADDVAIRALGRAFGSVPRVFTGPAAQPVCCSDPRAYLPEKKPNQVGYLVKFLNRGPGILANVASTNALLDAMARHSWTYLDGDSM